MGAAWCGELVDAEVALEHSSQAVRYLLAGKDDCVRKATKVRVAQASPLSPLSLSFSLCMYVCICGVCVCV
jgi:hypothetical protein